MSPSAASPLLLERAPQLDEIHDLLAAARAGRSGAILLRGPPGVGKSALLENAVQSAADMRILSVAGLESERGVAFGGLHRLFAPTLDAIEVLPDPQRDALSSTFGLMPELSTDRLVLGLAVLGLLSNAADEQPLLCIVEDAHWLDSDTAEILAFIARRIESEGIAIVLAMADVALDRDHFAGLRELRVEELSDEASRLLLSSIVSTPLAEAVRARLVDEAGGSPRALRELARALSRRQLAGSAVVPDSLPLNGRLEDGFLQRVRRLPAETQTLMLLVAADPRCEADLFWRAAQELRISADAASAAEAEGLLTVGSRVRFPNPLIRSAVYGAAQPAERRRVHLALAAAIAPATDRAHKAWHRAAAALGPDEELAAELVRAAAFVAPRKGYLAAAELLERAAGLTPDDEDRCARMVEAASGYLAAGALGRAASLLARVEAAIPSDRRDPRTRRLRGALTVARGENADAITVLLAAARAAEPSDPNFARQTYLEALEAAVWAGDLADPGTTLETAEAARASPRPKNRRTTGSDLLLDALASLLMNDRKNAAPSFRLAIAAFRRDPDPRWTGLAGHLATDQWDDESAHILAHRRVDLARTRGALLLLPAALSQLAGYEIITGRFDVAEGHIHEAGEICAATGNPGVVGSTKLAELMIAAWRGDHAEATRLAAGSTMDATARGQGILASFASYALAVLENGLGNYDAALTAAQYAIEGRQLRVASGALSELIEAAARGGEHKTAVEHVEVLSEMALPSGTNWALGMVARSRALVSRNSKADALFEESIAHLKRCRVAPELARTRLLYGEWLRRKRRRVDAREQLRAAHEALFAMGARGFAERAEVELRATGERVRRRSVESMDLLTPQEETIAELVAGGASNKDVAAKLYVSPRTVEYHLGKIFRKLRVSSRTELIADGREPRRDR